MSGCDIVLATQNATWSHPAFGLRCLRANLGRLRERTAILELDPRAAPEEAARAILERSPRIVGLGVYIWNVERLTAVAAALKRLRPDVVLVLGGPEISYEYESQPIASFADYIIRREGERAFAELCERLLRADRPSARVLDGGRPDLAQLALPYEEYDDTDVTRRFVYVETTRGCPFGCAFCLSALERCVREWPIDGVLDALDRLLRRGARRIKFVDRTFNLDPRRAARVMQFFLEHLVPGLTVHFEFHPMRLPSALRDILRRFPPGTLRLEVGVQTFDETVNARIGRRQSAKIVEENLRFLCQETAAHVHADLIAGLPGEGWAALAENFDRLFALGPEEIQIGILKRLRGSPLAEQAAQWGLQFDPRPPYAVRETPDFPAEALARAARTAAWWERLGNRRAFPMTLAQYLRDQPSPFAAFVRLSDALCERFGATHGVALDQLAVALFDFLSAQGFPPVPAAQSLLRDYSQGGRRRHPPRALRRFADAPIEAAAREIAGRGAD